MRDRKRPQYIENQIKEVNEYIRSKRLKDKEQYNDSLWCWFTQYLLENGWYRGYNMYIDHVLDDGTVVKILAGQDYSSKDYYLQIW